MRCRYFVTHLVKCGIAGNVSARAVGVRDHNRLLERRLFPEVLRDLREHLTGYARECDVVDHHQAQADVHWVGIRELVFRARTWTCFDTTPGTGDHLLRTPEPHLRRCLDGARHAYDFLSQD